MVQDAVTFAPRPVELAVFRAKQCHDSGSDAGCDVQWSGVRCNHDIRLLHRSSESRQSQVGAINFDQIRNCSFGGLEKF